MYKEISMYRLLTSRSVLKYGRETVFGRPKFYFRVVPHTSTLNMKRVKWATRRCFTGTTRRLYLTIRKSYKRAHLGLLSELGCSLSYCRRRSGSLKLLSRQILSRGGKSAANGELCAATFCVPIFLPHIQ